MDLVNAISIEYCEPTLSLSSRGADFPGMKALCSIKVVHFSPSDDRSLEETFEG